MEVVSDVYGTDYFQWEILGKNGRAYLKSIVGRKRTPPGFVRGGKKARRLAGVLPRPGGEWIEEEGGKGNSKIVVDRKLQNANLESEFVVDSQNMTDLRYRELMRDDSKELTEAEFLDGWHFCNEWDGLLVNYRDKRNEGKFCTEHCRPLPRRLEIL